MKQIQAGHWCPIMEKGFYPLGFSGFELREVADDEKFYLWDTQTCESNSHCSQGSGTFWRQGKKRSVDKHREIYQGRIPSTHLWVFILQWPLWSLLSIRQFIWRFVFSFLLFAQCDDQLSVRNKTPALSECCTPVCVTSGANHQQFPHSQHKTQQHCLKNEQ